MSERGAVAEYGVQVLVGLEFRPHRQRYNQPCPPGISGDCWRACIASIIGARHLDDVPHFLQLRRDAEAVDGQEHPWDDVRRAREWLRERNLDLGFVPIDAAIRSGVHWMATVRSHRVDGLHAVVADGDQVVWDPSGDDTYTFDEVLTEWAAEVIVEPYEPLPAQQIAQWLAAEGTAA